MKTANIHLFVFLLYAIMVSACNKPTYRSYYKYGNFTLTREDKGDDIYLYVEADKQNYITAHPNGFNGIVNGYIIFKAGVIEVLPDEGTFKVIGNSKTLRLKEVDAEVLFNWDEADYNLKNNGSLMHLYMYVWGEAIQNSKINCNIAATYDTALMNLGNR